MRQFSSIVAWGVVMAVTGCLPTSTSQRAFVPHFEEAKDSIATAESAKIKLARDYAESMKKEVGGLFDLAVSGARTAFEIRLVDAATKKAAGALKDDLRMAMAGEFFLPSYGSDGGPSVEAMDSALAELDTFIEIFSLPVAVKPGSTGSAFWLLYSGEIRGRPYWEVECVARGYEKAGILKVKQLLKDYNLKVGTLPRIVALNQARANVFRQIDTYAEANTDIARLDSAFAKDSIDLLTQTLMLMEDRQESVQLANRINGLARTLMDEVKNDHAKVDSAAGPAAEPANGTIPAGEIK